MNDRAREPAPGMRRRRPEHLDVVIHPLLRPGMPPPRRVLRPGFDQAAELIGLLLLLKSPRGGLPWAECRRDRVVDAAHEGKGREAVQGPAPQLYTYDAHIQDVTLCGSRQRSLLGPRAPDRHRQAEP